MLSKFINLILAGFYTLGHTVVGVFFTNRFFMGAPESRYKPLFLVGHPALWPLLSLLHAILVSKRTGFARSLLTPSFGGLWRLFFTYWGIRYLLQEVRRARNPRPCPPEILSTRTENRDLRRHIFSHDNMPISGLKGLFNRVNQLYDLEVITHEVTLPRLPREFNGFSIVQLTDTHHGPSISTEFTRSVVQLALDLQPDLVAFTGDYQTYPKHVESSISLLRPIGEWSLREREGMGAFAVLGNHDRGSGTAHVLDALRRAKVKVLNNRHTLLNRNGAPLYIAGVADPWSVRNDLDIALLGIPHGACIILLAHVPDFFVETEGKGISLQLSGHNHGGQIKVPPVGPILVSSRYGRRYTEGWFKQEDSLMYVSRGLGGKPAVRLGARPELVRFILRAPQP